MKKNESDRRILPLMGIRNCRDLGGIPVAGGKVVRPNCLIRCGRLWDMTGSDRRYLLEQSRLRAVVDLRNDQEIREFPDPALEGVRYCQVSILPGLRPGITREENGLSPQEKYLHYIDGLGPGGSRQLLEGLYPEMADLTAVEQLRLFFQILLEAEEGSVLFHCTSGKDRTGICAALILAVLGADENQIFSDYLYTNEQTAPEREALCQSLRQHGASETQIDQVRTLESVDRAYLIAFFHEIQRKYGSVTLFMENELGIGAYERQCLYTRFLQDS